MYRVLDVEASLIRSSIHAIHFNVIPAHAGIQVADHFERNKTRIPVFTGMKTCPRVHSRINLDYLNR